MQETPFTRLVPNDQLSAAEYNRLLDLVERLLAFNSVGIGLAVGSAGPQLRDLDPPFLWVKLTNNPDDQGRYSGIEQLALRQDKYLVWTDKPGGLVFSPCTYALYEQNDNFDVGPDTIVEAYRGVGDFWVFNYCCTGSGSGSGNCSGQAAYVDPFPIKPL